MLGVGVVMWLVDEVIDCVKEMKEKVLSVFGLICLSGYYAVSRGAMGFCLVGIVVVVVRYV